MPVGAEVGGRGGVDGPMDGDWAIRALFSLDLGAGVAEGRWSTGRRSGRGLQGAAALTKPDVAIAGGLNNCNRVEGRVIGRCEAFKVAPHNAFPCIPFYPPDQ